MAEGLSGFNSITSRVAKLIASTLRPCQHRTLLEPSKNAMPCRVRKCEERHQGGGRERDASEREPVAKRPPPEAAQRGP
jgi:hypothetical protein